MKLRLSPEQVKGLEGEAIQAFPAECCGLITGVGEGGGYRVTRLIASPNVTSADPACSFEVDPTLRIRLERELRDQKQGASPEVLIGHYHSHPNGPAAPSSHDLAQAYEQKLIWLIIGTASGRITGMAAYRLADSGDFFDAVEIS
jgi:proteasome lid subunit RPN8/RPN11